MESGLIGKKFTLIPAFKASQELISTGHAKEKGVYTIEDMVYNTNETRIAFISEKNNIMFIPSNAAEIVQFVKPSVPETRALPEAKKVR